MLDESGATIESLVKEGSDATFVADVIEASKTTPIIVDFWATWCGPCRQLTPALEKAVREAKGKVKLVKIDVDKNPQIAAQLRVQSIPTVYGFVDGAPVDGFQGAVAESEIKSFIGRLTKDAPPSDVDAAVAAGDESFALGDIGGAAQSYAGALQLDPANVKAIAGLARCYISGGDMERAREVADMAPADAKGHEIESVRTALKFAEEAPDDTSALEQRLAKDPKDHEARLELAKAQAGHGEMKAAVDNLLLIVQADRDWNDGAARQQLITVFDAAGANSDVAKQGRKRLSSILFS